jgi:hypothetical protein
MDLRVLSTALALSLALALIGFALHSTINAALGLKESILDSAWQSLALGIGLSILISLFWPYARGVRKGDRLVAQVPRTQNTPGGVFAFVDNVVVTALENGHSGGKIKVRIGNGKTGEGIITSYAGTFTPAAIQITETES